MDVQKWIEKHNYYSEVPETAKYGKYYVVFDGCRVGKWNQTLEEAKSALLGQFEPLNVGVELAAWVLCSIDSTLENPDALKYEIPTIHSGSQGIVPIFYFPEDGTFSDFVDLDAEIVLLPINFPVHPDNDPL